MTSPPQTLPSAPPETDRRRAAGRVVRAVLLAVAPVLAVLVAVVVLAGGERPRTALVGALAALLGLLALAGLLPRVVAAAMHTGSGTGTGAAAPGAAAPQAAPPSRRRRRRQEPDAFQAVLDELEQSSAAAAAAAAALRAYFESASQDLQAPLAELRRDAETLLRAEPGSAERQRLAVSMVEQTREAGRLVEDLVVVAKLDTRGELEDLALAREPVDLVALAAEEVERAAQLTPDRTYETTVDGLPHDGTQSLVVTADPLRLGQALANVLDNARYATGPGGRIHVDVRRQGALALVTLWDTGEGVPPQEHELVLTHGAVLPPDASRRTASAGVGLPIARALARAHGGDVVCIDRRGEPGGCFQLALPAGRG